VIGAATDRHGRVIAQSLEFNGYETIFSNTILLCAASENLA
jgi:hypothetical protein